MPSASHDQDDAAPESAEPGTGDMFARLVAHAINNPLAALLMNLELASELLDPGSGSEAGKRVEEARRLLVEVHKSALRVHEVVQDLGCASTTADAVRMLSVTPSVAPASSRAPKAAVARVLVVDDDALVARAVKRTLREHDVVVQGSAREALALLEAGERFDVLLCDLIMPDLTGMDLYEAVLRLDRSQAERMVFVTGGPVTKRAREFVASTQNHVLDKPFDVRRLREIIARKVSRVK
jgi:CheY-like chemotaxis protein